MSNSGSVEASNLHWDPKIHFQSSPISAHCMKNSEKHPKLPPSMILQKWKVERKIREIRLCAEGLAENFCFQGKTSLLYKLNLKNIFPFTLKILEGGGGGDIAPTSPLLTSPPPSFLPPETQANICYHKVLDSTRTRSKLDFNCALCSLTEKKLRKPQEIWDMLEFKRTKELTMGQKVLWIRLL